MRSYKAVVYWGEEDHEVTFSIRPSESKDKREIGEWQLISVKTIKGEDITQAVENDPKFERDLTQLVGLALDDVLDQIGKPDAGDALDDMENRYHWRN